MKPSSLEDQLEGALKSREARHIRRSLPPPTDTNLVDFSSNDYLSLSKSSELRGRFLEKLSSAEQILGSGGSRLLINGSAHVALEHRLAFFFNRSDGAPIQKQSPPQLDALLFNSGFDANVGFFACVPQRTDFIVYDEYVHASVHDGMRMSRAQNTSFKHNSLTDLERVFLHLKSDRPGLVDGKSSVFVAIESLYSMDGTISPLADIIQLAESAFPNKNAYVFVDEAHSTGIYGSRGRGLLDLLGLQGRVFARLHTFGKALAGTGGESARSDIAKPPVEAQNSCLTCSTVGQTIFDQLCSDVDLHDFPELRQHHPSWLLFRPLRFWTCRGGTHPRRIPYGFRFTSPCFVALTSCAGSLRILDHNSYRSTSTLANTDCARNPLDSQPSPATVIIITPTPATSHADYTIDDIVSPSVGNAFKGSRAQRSTHHLAYRPKRKGACEDLPPRRK